MIVLVIFWIKVGVGNNKYIKSRFKFDYLIVFVVVGLIKWFCVMSCMMSFVIVIVVLVSINVVVFGIWVMKNIFVLFFCLCIL